MQLEAVYLTTTCLSAKRKTSVIVSSSYALRNYSWEYADFFLKELPYVQEGT